MFCDADDFFEPDAVAFIYHLLNSSDSGNAGGNSFDAIIYGYNLVREHSPPLKFIFIMSRQSRLNISLV